MNRYIAFLTLFFVFSHLSVNAQVAENNAFKSLPNKKPKVALVLSGGGAKGVAHIPTLQTLDSLGIVPDLIVGNSMGSIMGGLYAMGYSGDSIVNLVKQTNWEDRKSVVR